MTLYGRCTTTNITLKSALSNCATALSEAVAIIYSPTCCQFAKVQENGDLTNSKNEIISLDKVFELRAFNENCELRWLNESNGKGKAVLISEQKQNISDYLDADISEIKELHENTQQYILWGEGVKTVSASGWGKLDTARIGSIDVPIKGLTGGGKRVYLNAIEYLKADEEYGNVSVVEERLIKLEVK